ncbi:hypothetical protein ACJRO7_014632 [Eucalyptus globulus]|uniref:SWIM-type domain-containing protein n=1 Tax=Eucalyptus globulus TaxID=34317 RepID=A0ABD3L0T6_EUCGL
MEASNDNIIAHNVNEEFEFRIGMVFTNENEAYNTYNAYAICKGFGVRKRTKSEQYNCEGHSPPIPPHEQRNVYRTVKRTRCQACIKFKIKNGVWEVTKFEDVHNHPFIEDKQKHLIRSYRHITDTSKGILTSMTGAGIRATKAYSYLCDEAGGANNIGFTLRDCQNFLQSKRMNLINVGDCQRLINHFNCLQSNGSNFSYTFQLNEDQRLTDVFWSDGISKLDYDSFGDVVVFDTTYRTNKYNMICAPFVGVNHHWKNVLFGCAFLIDETIASFVWAFQSFLEAMGNKALKTIFTDQDHAMANAIRTVFPNSDHRLCIWHIGKNVTHHIAHLLGKPGFRDKYWHKLLYRCESEIEMETTWKAMCQEWNLSENKWLDNLYRMRIRSTQRSESANNVFQDIACKTMTLSEFVGHYEKQAEKMRNTEIVDDFECARGKPHIMVENRISRLSSYILSEHVLRSETDGPLHTYIFGTGSNERKHIVHFSRSDSTIFCSCKLFEMQGWLCRHALYILTNVANVTSIPSQYILKMWTKVAKQEIYCEDVAQSSHDAVKSKTLRLKRLMQLAFSVMNDSVNHDVTEELATTALLRLRSQITTKMQSLISKYHVDFLGEGDESEYVQNHGIRVFDPLKRRPKGVPNTRIKGAAEKRKRKASSCVGAPRMRYDTCLM